MCVTGLHPGRTFVEQKFSTLHVAAGILIGYFLSKFVLIVV